ncbi:MAG: hypothetical protein ACXWDO_04410 [Bacteroidia bacterium]
MNNNLDSDEDKSSFYKGFFNEGLYVVNEPDLPIHKKAEKSGEEEIAVPEHAFLSVNGNKMAKTLLLFNYANTERIPESDKIFINQVLNAVKLSLENVAWLNIAKQINFSWEALNAQPQIEKIIAFGIDETLYPELITEGQIHIYNNQKILRAGKLADISMNKSQKILLWDGLKQLYGL